MKGLIIAGTHSGCGKTTITLGILAALKKNGLKVQPFKTGPDFIDSGLHRMITGRPSRNLDLWMCGEDYVKACYSRNSADADISVVEGVMGLYDGSLSTASLAARLGIPVVLVIDAYGMAETAGAIVQGIRDFRPPLSPLLVKEGMGEVNSSLITRHSSLNFAGVIFNRVASESHFNRLKESVSGIPVLGYLPRDINFEIPHRHLGLTTAEENPMAEENIEKLADTVLQYIDTERMVQSAAIATALSFPAAGNPSGSDEEGLQTVHKDGPKIAVARDTAFCFYYEDNFDLLRAAGAELVFFSPLTDSQLPDDIDGIYIGGGYPELHAAQLSGNSSMLRSVRDWTAADGPIYAECGGLMYLSSGIHDLEEHYFSMAGVFPFETVMKKGRSRLGYREICLEQECVLGSRGVSARGHEFHYSEIRDGQAHDLAGRYTVKNGSGDALAAEGYACRSALASYIHLHFGSNSSIAGNMVNFMKRAR